MSEELAIIAAVNECLANSKDASAGIRSSLGVIRERTGSTRAFAMLYKAETDGLETVAADGLTISEFRKLDAKADSCVLRAVFDQSDSHVIRHAEEEPTLEYLYSSLDPKDLCTVPIIAATRSIGILACEFEPSTNAAAEFQTLLEIVGSMIGQSMRIDLAVRGERQKLIDENSHLKLELKEKHDFSQIVGTSNPMKHVFDQVSQVARSNATVLLRGESGTGKEMIANAIHYNSLRSKRPLVKINCAALPESLIEAELFGHEKGAFTGADRFKKGRFELADGGTLFLDEIGDLPVQTQVKLLRALQEREFERLGGTETIKTNIRLITATNKNLEQAIAAGEFREDLYYRLNVFSIYLPPLRERKPDILLLAEHFLEKYEKEHGKRIRRISTPAIDMLMSYHFPGNVRELENAVERAVLVCDSNVIHGHHLPPTLQTAEVSGTVTDLGLASAVAAFERDLIQDTLKSTRGNIAKAAKSLDSTERILGYKIKKYGIDTMRFRR